MAAEQRQMVGQPCWVLHRRREWLALCLSLARLAKLQRLAGHTLGEGPPADQGGASPAVAHGAQTGK